MVRKVLNKSTLSPFSILNLTDDNNLLMSALDEIFSLLK